MAKKKDARKESDKAQDEKQSGGTSLGRIFLKTFILVFLSAYTAAAILVHCPADLSGIKGYPAADAPAAVSGDPGDLIRRLSEAAILRLDPIALEEAEINAYIAAHLEAHQIGYSGRYITFKNVWVDFEENRCLIYMERELFGRPSTVGVELKITREGKQFLTEFTGGRFGRLKVTQGFLLLVKHAYDRLATQVFADELELIFQMNQIRFDKDRLILDPRFPKNVN